VAIDNHELSILSLKQKGRSKPSPKATADRPYVQRAGHVLSDVPPFF